MSNRETIAGQVVGVNTIHCYRHGREQENWTYAIDLGKVLDLMDLALL